MPAPDGRRQQPENRPGEPEDELEGTSFEPNVNRRQQPEDELEGASFEPNVNRRQQPEDELEGTFYQPNVNQRRHEPMPASPQDEKRQEAVEQNEAYAHGYAQPESREGQGGVPGDLTPGPEDPGTPPTHATSGDADDGRVGRVRRVARAVRGRPDGEVDPQS